MNKSELVDSIAEGAGLSKADAERALNALIDAVQAAVANDDKVTLPGFGSFSGHLVQRAQVVTRARVSRSRSRRPRA